MASIAWLDDDSDLLDEALRRLARAGHDVHPIVHEDDFVAELARGWVPDVLVQDLRRPFGRKQVPGGPPRRVAPDDDPDLAGWKFYAEVMRPCFPQVPVVVCSLLAGRAENLRRAEDFNLRLLSKREPFHVTLVHEIEQVLAAQRLVHRTEDPAPAILAVDFARANEELVRHLARRPTDLHEVGWSTFEELVGWLLERMGYEVHHTPLTRDGGVDLWAVRRDDLGPVRYAIDTKKYAPHRLVGPAPVRAIYGVTSAHDATMGMIVTTSGFGEAALRFGEQHRYRLSLKDFDGVVGWIRAVAGRSRW